MNEDLELTKVRQNLTEWLASFNAKDIDALMNLYDPESVYANAGAPLMRGVSEIKPWYEQAFTMISGKLLYNEEEYFISGDLATLVGNYYFQLADGQMPPEGMVLTGRVALTYRRNEQGDWKLLFDMDNNPPDVTPQLFAA